MILNSVRAIAMAVPSRRIQWRKKPMCCTSTVNSEQLRSQLDQLHSEAETTRIKANNARLRLLRLSEAAENLQKQAAVCVQKGKENDARELLFQRKKVLQALEKSKSRIELLDELSTKLNEAITLKESQLIVHVAVNIEDKPEDGSGPVRIIAPKEEVREDFTEDDSHPDMIRMMNFSDSQDAQPPMESQGSLRCDEETKYLQRSLSTSSWNDNHMETEDLQRSLSTGNWNEDNTARGLRQISSYEAFMKYIDQQLSDIEAELVTVLNVSTLIMDGAEKPKNSKVQQMVELLESIHGIRQRISNIKAAKVKI